MNSWFASSEYTFDFFIWYNVSCYSSLNSQCLADFVSDLTISAPDVEIRLHSDAEWQNIHQVFDSRLSSIFLLTLQQMMLWIFSTLETFNLSLFTCVSNRNELVLVLSEECIVGDLYERFHFGTLDHDVLCSTLSYGCWMLIVFFQYFIFVLINLRLTENWLHWFLSFLTFFCLILAWTKYKWLTLTWKWFKVAGDTEFRGEKSHSILGQSWGFNLNVWDCLNVMVLYFLHQYFINVK